MKQKPCKSRANIDAACSRKRKLRRSVYLLRSNCVDKCTYALITSLSLCVQGKCTYPGSHCCTVVFLNCDYLLPIFAFPPHTPTSHPSPLSSSLKTDLQLTDRQLKYQAVSCLVILNTPPHFTLVDKVFHCHQNPVQPESWPRYERFKINTEIIYFYNIIYINIYLIYFN